MGPEFFQTKMGRIFYEAQLPELNRQLKRIADALEAKPKLIEKLFDPFEKADQEAAGVKHCTCDYCDGKGGGVHDSEVNIETYIKVWGIEKTKQDWPKEYLAWCKSDENYHQLGDTPIHTDTPPFEKYDKEVSQAAVPDILITPKQKGQLELLQHRLQDLLNAYNDIVGLWIENDAIENENLLRDKYPFKESFDEIDIREWVNTSIQKIDTFIIENYKA